MDVFAFMFLYFDTVVEILQGSVLLITEWRELLKTPIRINTKFLPSVIA